MKVPSEGYLGIHLSPDKATVVCFESSSAESEPVAAFDVTAPEKSGFTELAQAIAQQCSQKSLNYNHIAVSLDSSLYMQHDVHSSFTDKKQLASTVRFDTEDALAADVGEVGIAFRVVSADENGSSLDVFTAPKSLLAEVINALNSNGFDPAFIEPDSASLYRYITDHRLAKNETAQSLLFVALSEKNGYLAGPFNSNSETIPKQRTFLITAGQDKTILLQRQLPLTLAQLGDSSAVEKIEIVDASGTVDTEKLGVSLHIGVENVALQIPELCSDAVTYIAACGAALSSSEKEHTISFRSDYMPYLGRRRKIETTLRIASISLCVVLVALGLNLQIRLMQKNKPVRQLHKRFAEEYSAVMLGAKMPGKSANALRKLRSTRNKIKSARSGASGFGDQKTIPAKLTAILASFNAVAKKTNLNIEKISITSKNITVSGDTSSRANTLRLLAEIKKTMNVQQERLGSKDRRDTFSITVIPKGRQAKK